jgi:nitrous oxidase accessory protein
MERIGVHLSVVVMPIIVGLIAANSCWAFNVSQDTSLDKDYNEPFVITANNVTLECAGHTIRGNGNGNGLTLTNIQRATVRNCRITNFNRGVLLDGTTDSVFEGNEVNNNRGSGMCNAGAEGFHLQRGSNRNLFARNTVHDNSRDGFDLDFSDGNAFVLNFVEHNGTPECKDSSGISHAPVGNGIELDNCNDNDIIANLINGNIHTGVSLDASLRNVIDKNVINDNGFWGIRFAMRSNNNIVRYNELCGNKSPGPPNEFDINTASNQVILNFVCP